MAITTLLLDCDGVTQLNRTFRDALHRMVHPQDGMLLREALWQVERPFLARRDGFEDAMDRLVTDFNAEHGTRLTVDEILAEWNATEPVPAVLDVMDAVRARGTRLYLATNQQSVRGAHIQQNLPYAEHSDGAFYSFELGVAKPSPEFFTTIVERLGIAPGEALFVDDLAANVDGARAAGLVAEQLEPVCDAAVLTAILDRHGLLG